MKHKHNNLNPKAFGQWAENRAKSYLLRSGYKIIDQNWHAQIPGNEFTFKLKGELDLVAISPKNILCFIEVKASRKSKINPEWAVHSLKRKQIKALANIYIWRHRLEEFAVEFQVITLKPYKNIWQLKLYESAFI